MKTFYIHFLARKINAIGIRQKHCIKISHNSLKDAVLSLYDIYNHISILKISNTAYKRSRTTPYGKLYFSSYSKDKFL